MQVSLLNHPKLKDWKREIETFTQTKKESLENANDTEDAAKHTILSGPRHRLTLLIARHCHQRVTDCGLKETLTELRSQVRGRHFTEI